MWIQISMAFKARCFGGLSQIQVLKVGAPNVKFKPFAPQGETWVLSSLLLLGHSAEGWVYGKIVPQPLLLALI